MSADEPSRFSTPSSRDPWIRSQRGRVVRLSELEEDLPPDTRVLLVEDHELLAQSLTASLQSEGIHAESVVVDSIDTVVEKAQAGEFDVVLLDYDLGAAGTGLQLIPSLQARGARVVILTASTDDTSLAECIEAGAIGVVRKTASFEQLLDAIREAVTLGTLLTPTQRTELMAELRRQRKEQADRMRVFETLTPREQDVLAALMDGKTPNQIARERVVSITTVRGQVRSLLSKLRVHSQVEAIGLARRAGWEAPRRRM